MSIEIVNSYFHPSQPNDFVVVEVKKDGLIHKENVSIDDIIMDWVRSYPVKNISDGRLFKKAREAVLSRYK